MFSTLVRDGRIFLLRAFAFGGAPCDLRMIRSRIASAIVGMPFKSCHLATSRWAVIGIDLRW